jgi:predicted nucleotidyltransferase
MKENPLKLDEEDWSIFIDILNKYDYTFYAYGSRVKGANKKFSDIDLCVLGDIDLVDIREDFYNSNLPCKVDIKKITELSQDFFALIKADLVLLKLSTNKEML